MALSSLEVCRDKVDAPLAKLGVTDFLHHQVASEPAGRLDDDRPHTVALGPFEHRSEARARVDGISAAHKRVVELPMRSYPARRANAWIASRWRRSMPAPTFAAELVASAAAGIIR